jgi:hypothetical protein
MKATTLVSHAIGVFGVLAILAGTAEAGPPLICHPFDAGSAALLPWGTGQGWNTPSKAYDAQRLVADTLRLLSPEAPILARMENMRRATIYATQDARVASALLAAIQARASADSKNVLAAFDAGYIVESYKQAAWSRMSIDAPKTDGYAIVRTALAAAGPNPAMEFAAALMTEGATSAAHRQRAQAGAAAGSPLASNIAKLFSN